MSGGGESPRERATELLAGSRGGDAHAASELLTLLYDELRRIAGRLMADERTGHSLQPTALVHEVYLRLVESAPASWEDRAHFVALVTRVMRRVLVDHARSKGRLKRGGDGLRVELDPDLVATPDALLDLVLLDDLLSRLESEHSRAARIVEERVFGGLTVAEVASVHGISTTTVEADWRFARAWLTDQLRGEHA